MAKSAIAEVVGKILKAGLNKSELTVLSYLMELSDSQDGKAITKPHSEMAKKVGFAASNFSRAIKALEGKSVISVNDNQIKIRAVRSWGMIIKSDND